MYIKQVIIVRKDLNMRKGKIAAQVAHASLAVILQFYKGHTNDSHDSQVGSEVHRPHIQEWIDSLFTKIVLSVNSEQELVDIFTLAKDKNLPCSLITDAGLTEFNGVPTITCAAIGPTDSFLIDEITGSLKLL